jgi:hypothetical protein
MSPPAAVSINPNIKASMQTHLGLWDLKINLRGSI